MPIKTTLKNYLTMVRMAIIRKIYQEQILQRLETKGNLPTLLVGCKWVQPLRKAAWRFLKIFNTLVAYDPEIPLLGSYTEKNHNLK